MPTIIRHFNIHEHKFHAQLIMKKVLLPKARSLKTLQDSRLECVHFSYFLTKTYGPRCKKTCLWGFRQSEFQTSLLSFWNWNYTCTCTCSKFTYHTFQKVNNEGADQTAPMWGLVFAFVVWKPRRQVFSRRGPYIIKGTQKNCLNETHSI